MHSGLVDLNLFCCIDEIWASEKQTIRLRYCSVLVYDVGHWRQLFLCWWRSRSVGHMGSQPCLFSEWFVAVFAFVNSLDLCIVKKQTSCGTADKTRTWSLTNTEWKDWTECCVVLPFMPVSMFCHRRHGKWEKLSHFSVYVSLDELERCFAFCKSKILIFLYPLTYIERFYNNVIRGLYFIYLFFFKGDHTYSSNFYPPITKSWLNATPMNSVSWENKPTFIRFSQIRSQQTEVRKNPTSVEAHLLV